MPIRPRRSALYMPASNARAIDKARTLACDVVILDLEDAVAPEGKEAARAAAVAAVAAGGFGRREVVIRVNGLDTPWGLADLRAVAAAGCDGVLLPKVSDGTVLEQARAALAGNTPLWAMIETCRAVLNLAAIVDAAAAAGLTTLVAGTNDLVKEMRCRPGADRAPLLPILAQIVVAARMAGLAALDGVCNTFDDAEIVAAECRQGLAWGFDGKTLIHPAQIDAANRTFTPTADEIAWARRITDAFADPANAGKGVVRVDGRMVELLHLDEAARTLAIAEQVRAG